jgi:hypothetical protein
MPWVAIVFVALIIAVIATYLVMQSRKYSRLYDESTFQEFYERLTEAIRAAVQAPGEPSIDNVKGFRLSADIGASVSFHPHDDEFILHVALSQPDSFTTHAVASRFGFFVVAMLNRNQAQMTPFFTPSSVHHIVLKLKSADIVFNDFEQTYDEYLRNYQPIPFEAADEPEPPGE